MQTTTRGPGAAARSQVEDDMRIFIVLGAALGGLAFWRRKTLKADADRAVEAAKSAKQAASERIGRSSDESDALTDVADAVAEGAEAVAAEAAETVESD